MIIRAFELLKYGFFICYFILFYFFSFSPSGYFLPSIIRNDDEGSWQRETPQGIWGHTMSRVHYSVSRIPWLFFSATRTISILCYTIHIFIYIYILKVRASRDPNVLKYRLLRVSDGNSVIIWQKRCDQKRVQEQHNVELKRLISKAHILHR